MIHPYPIRKFSPCRVLSGKIPPESRKTNKILTILCYYLQDLCRKLHIELVKQFLCMLHNSPQIRYITTRFILIQSIISNFYGSIHRKTMPLIYIFTQTRPGVKAFIRPSPLGLISLPRGRLHLFVWFTLPTSQHTLSVRAQSSDDTVPDHIRSITLHPVFG